MKIFRKLSRRRFVSVFVGAFSFSAMPLRARSQSTLLGLREAVRIPVNRVARDWQQHPFEAWVSGEEIESSGAGAEKSFDRLFFGLLTRLPVQAQNPDNRQDAYIAYCSFCPHEACEVKLVDASSSLKLEEETETGLPLLVCPCHFSVFDPREQGRLLSGPAPRGLYRFEFRREKDDIVITHIESAALALFQS